MRIVLDTNVLVSAALKDSSVPALAVLAAAKFGTLLKSADTERQLFGVLGRPYFQPLISPAARQQFAALMDAAESVIVRHRIAACRDATDDRFLELAVAGGADVIVSGDADLLVLHPFRGIPILRPAAFLQFFGANQGPRPQPST